MYTNITMVPTIQCADTRYIGATCHKYMLYMYAFYVVAAEATIIIVDITLKNEAAMNKRVWGI